MNNFATRLKLLRKNKWLSQGDLANALSVSQQAVAFWEVSRNQPNNKTLVELADYFDVTTDYLLGRGEDGYAIDESNDEEPILGTKEILFSHMRRLNEAADKTNNVDELFSIALAMQSITDAIVSLETEDI